MQCNSCHTEVSNDTVFCPSCGANLSKQQAEASQTVSQLQESLKNASIQIASLQNQLVQKKTSSPAGLIITVVILALASVIATIRSITIILNAFLLRFILFLLVPLYIPVQV